MWATARRGDGSLGHTASQKGKTAKEEDSKEGNKNNDGRHKMHTFSMKLLRQTVLSRRRLRYTKQCTAAAAAALPVPLGDPFQGRGGLETRRGQVGGADRGGAGGRG